MSRVVVVTGGTKGIGKAVAERFSTEDVVAPSHDELDVTNEEQVAAFFEGLGQVDVLVNNAGIGAGAPLARTTLDDWRAHLEVNATGAFLCTRAVVGGMIERGDGRIVTVASIAGLAGMRYTAAYAASKHAAVGLMRATAAEVGGPASPRTLSAPRGCGPTSRGARWRTSSRGPAGLRRKQKPSWSR